MKAIELNNLSFSYNQRPVLKSVNLIIEKGEFVSIIGPNGAGKSTLLRVIAGILKNFSGEVQIFDQNIKDLKSKVLARILSFVPQETHFLHNYSVGDIVLMGRYPYLEPFQRLSREDLKAVDWAMEKTNIKDLQTRPVNSLSSGERQMVVISRALAQRPQILLLDEPTSHLDIQHQIKIMDLLKDLNKDGMTILMVNHDLNLAAQFSEKLIMFYQGTIYKWGKPSEIIKPETIRDVYGVEVEIIIHPVKNTPQIFAK
ncbi:MAG: ABC transporter ATP-binding protein [candidate division WOR-3 bacterium]